MFLVLVAITRATAARCLHTRLARHWRTLGARFSTRITRRLPIWPSHCNLRMRPILAAHEVRASALHFQLRDALGDHSNKGKAFKQCVPCPDLLKGFLSSTSQGQVVARERLQKDPGYAEALFFLGKLNLIYVWLHVETLGRKTGWNEYWEARRSLDAFSKGIRRTAEPVWREPGSTTSSTQKWREGTRWLLGGGSKKRAFIDARPKGAAPNE